MLNRLFQRKFGIAVRKVGVRSEIPWPFRILIWAGVIALAMVFAGALYDAGRRFAGFDRAASESRLDEAIAKVAVLESQLARAQEALRAGEGRLAVEASSVARLAQQLKAVQDENLALKEELSLFEGLVSTANTTGGPPVRVVRGVVERVAAGRYRYRLVLVHQASQRNSKDFVGSFRVELRVRANGGDVMMTVPAAGAADQAAYRLSFRQIHRVEGEFVIPGGAELVGSDLFITQGGGTVLRHSLKL